MSEIQGVAQVALSVRDLARAAAFYRDGLGLKHLFDVPGMSFFDVGGVRLMLSAQGGEPGTTATVVYLKVDDLNVAHRALTGRGVPFKQEPHVVGRTPDREVSLAFCTDPDGNLIGLMSERALD
jgi:catechol 2,3-dioxygenase-like lactoylglutathione lyase family enzyme